MTPSFTWHLSELALAEQMNQGATLTEEGFHRATALCAAHNILGVIVLLGGLGFDVTTCLLSTEVS